MILRAIFLVFVSVSAFNSLADSADLSGVYGVHLFFNETEFVDVLTVSKNEKGEYEGLMHVPNDFDAEIENVTLKEGGFTFEILVPKNSSRPKDLIFHYDVRFFNGQNKQMLGFVTLKGQKEFIASFVGFKRESSTQ